VRRGLEKRIRSKNADEAEAHRSCSKCDANPDHRLLVFHEDFSLVSDASWAVCPQVAVDISAPVPTSKSD